MNELERNLIAAYAEGSLPSDEVARVEGLLETSAEARSELAAQRAALAALREAPSPVLSVMERTALRDAIAERLGVVAAPEPEPVRSRWRLSWAGLAAATAVLTVVVVGAGVVRTLSIGDRDGAADTTISSEMQDRDAAAVTTDGPAEEDGAPAAPTDDNGPEFEASGGDAPPAIAGAPSSLAPDRFYLFDLGAIDEDSAQQLSDGARAYRSVADFEDYLRSVGAEEIESISWADEEPRPCVEESLTSFPGAAESLILGTATYEGSRVFVFAVFTEDVEEAPATLVLLDASCAVAGVFPPAG